MIEIRNLSKAYGGHWALRGVTFTIHEGDMFGLIGPNGAGKTTLIRILATLLRPTSGFAYVAGFPVVGRGYRVRRVIGYLPDTFGVYEDMRVSEYLHFFAASYGIGGIQRKKAVEGVLELTDLTGKRDSLIGTLSRGMQQRLGLARVLVHDPQVLLLDEPASGLDPRARVEMRELLKTLRTMQKTILISSHILADLSDMCNRIGLLERGRLLYAGAIDEAIRRARAGETWFVEVGDGEVDRAKALLEGQAFVQGVRVRDGRLLVTLQPGSTDTAWIPKVLVENGFSLHLFKPAEVTLEEAFMRLTRGEVS